MECSSYVFCHSSCVLATHYLVILSLLRSLWNHWWSLHCNCLALIDAIYSQIGPFVALNRTFSSSNDSFTKTQKILRRKMKENIWNFFTNQLSTRSIKCLYRLENRVFERLNRAISKQMKYSGKWLNLSRAIFVWNRTCDFKSNSCYAFVRFRNHSTYDFRPILHTIH